jgi:hypothetical protein
MERNLKACTVLTNTTQPTDRAGVDLGCFWFAAAAVLAATASVNKFNLRVEHALYINKPMQRLPAMSETDQSRRSVPG